jgi:bleomycin hydrolase
VSCARLETPFAKQLECGQQSYLFFWDKLNKSNYYLELAIENADKPIDDRLVDHLSDDLISDGGQYDMAVNLLTSYGVVPQGVFPESLHSSLSGPLNTLLKRKLREHALVLRRLSYEMKEQAVEGPALRDALRAKKEMLMKDIYTVMSATLGVPPLPTTKFSWDYYDKAGKPCCWKGTPLEFFEQFASKPYHVSQCIEQNISRTDRPKQHHFLAEALLLID